MRKSRKIFLLNLALMVADVAIAVFSLFGTLWLSSGFTIDKITLYTWCFVPLCFVILPIIEYFFRVNRISWRQAGYRDVTKLGSAIIVGISGSLFVTFIIADGKPTFTWSDVVCTLLLAIMVSTAVRMLLRDFLIRFNRTKGVEKLEKNGEIPDYGRVLLIGAGVAGERLLRAFSLDANFAKSEVVGIIDDDPEKHGSLIRGVEVIGGREVIFSAVNAKNVKTIFFAIPTATGEQRRDILRMCSETGRDIRIMTGIDESFDISDTASRMRKVNIGDLLGRDSVEMDIDKVGGYVKDKTVLVTGGGGSIGSELCRQIALLQPKKLIILDIYENNAYDILNELRRSHPTLDVIVLIGSVREEKRLNSIFEEYRPDVVYHAAAHKHVPLMEDSPHEAVKNNVFGTLNTVRAADKYGTKRFVMISTDKAVNPTNVMGTTKRVCEMIIQTYNRRSATEFVAVRFGNVLGSNGSVIPLFERQISEGGPVTVTHPDIIRYFMTIPEAVSLVITAGATARGGEIFVLDMGAPVKIVDLAENMIRLSGFEPYRDIDIKFTGLRPGEKLFEELLMDEEGLEKTENSLIYIGQPIKIDEETLFPMLDELWKAASDDKADVRAALHRAVPTFKENNL